MERPVVDAHRAWGVQVGDHNIQINDFAAQVGQQAQAVVAEHRKLASAGVRTTIGDESSGGPVEIAFADRRERLAGALMAAGTERSALLISGESGVGKSALTLSTLGELEAADPAAFAAVVVNFRSLPQSSLELRAALGMSMESVLSELSTPSRVLLVDAADAALERSAGLLNDLVLAAAGAGVGIVAVASDVASGFVRDQLELGFGKSISSFTVAAPRRNSVFWTSGRCSSTPWSSPGTKGWRRTADEARRTMGGVRNNVRTEISQNPGRAP